MDKKSSFRDMYYVDGEKPVFCFRSGLAVYEESFESGMLVAKGRNASGYPLNVLSNCPTRLDARSFSRPQAFHLELDGESADTYLTLSGYATEDTENGMLVKVILRSSLKPVEVTVCTLLDGTSVMTRYLEIKNLSGKCMSLSRLAVISGGTESMRDINRITKKTNPSEFYSLGYYDYAEWGREGDFSFHDLHPDKTSFGGRFDRDRFRQPFFMLKNNLMGTILFGQLAWSGGFEFSFDYNSHNEKNSTDLCFEVGLSSNKPMLVLEGGECYTTPAVHMGFIAGDVDDAVNEMNTHTRSSVLVLPEASPDFLVGSGMGAEHDMSLETTKSFIDQMAYIGCELFIIDAGWYCPSGEEQRWSEYAGDWTTYADRYPGGIAEIRNYAHSKGMKFGLWVEIERIAKRSEMFLSHPEWRTVHVDGESAEEFIDFTNPDCAKWAENKLAEIIEKTQTDLLRVDYNVINRDYFYMVERDGKKECASLRHFDAVYNLYKKLKIRFPGVTFENCAGGGGRCDLGILKAFNHTWVSDCQTAPRSLYITNGMTLMLPPERVDRLVAGMGCHSFASLDFQMRNAMLGHLSMNVFSPAAAQYNIDQLDFIRHSIDVYKTRIRSILPSCLIYHHEPEIEKVKSSGSTALEIFAPDGKKGAITVFTVPGYSGSGVVIYPKGCDASMMYDVTFDNSGKTVKLSGFAMKNDGVRIKLSSPMTSELLLFECFQDK